MQTASSLTNLMQIDELPDELLLWILKMVPAKDVARLSRVSQRWNALCSIDSLWREIYAREARLWRVVGGIKGRASSFLPMVAERPNQLLTKVLNGMEQLSAFAADLAAGFDSEAEIEAEPEAEREPRADLESWRDMCIKGILAEDALRAEEKLNAGEMNGAPSPTDTFRKLHVIRAGGLHGHAQELFWKLLAPVGLSPYPNPGKPDTVLILGQEGLGRKIMVRQLMDCPVNSDVSCCGYFGGLRGGVAFKAGRRTLNVVSLHRVNVLDEGVAGAARKSWRETFAEASGIIYATENTSKNRLMEDRQMLTTILTSDALGVKPNLPLVVLVRQREKEKEKEQEQDAPEPEPDRSVADIAAFLGLQQLCAMHGREWVAVAAGEKSPGGARLGLRWIADKLE